MHMISFCTHLSIRLVLKSRIQKKLEKTIVKLEEYFAMRYFSVEHVLPGFLFWIQIP